MGQFKRSFILDRSWGYAIVGFCLGLLAPVGWWVIRLLFFDGLDAVGQASAATSMAAMILNVYMGGGTAVVLGGFGFFIGKATQQIHNRAFKLDELNQIVETQKEEFERRFNNLNNGIKNFHAINMHIQKTSDAHEVLKLSADGLHSIIGYDRVNIFLTDLDRAALKLVATRSHEDRGETPYLELPLDPRAGAIYKAVHEKRTILVDDIRKMPEEFHLKPPCDQSALIRSRSFILCPIIVHREVVGLFGVDNKDSRELLDETDVDTVKLFADQVASTLTKLNLLEAVESLTHQLLNTFNQLQGFQDDYGRLDQALKLATDSTVEATKDIVGAAGVVRESVDTTRSASGEISVSIQQVSENLNQLAGFVSNSVSSVTEISAAVHSMQDNAVRSHSMSETVKQKADQGTKGVRLAMKGLEGIAQAVNHASGSIETLSRTGEEAGHITTVITEITQKTNLLALNAAIIAAQAGDYGRSFAVVADEVRSLSQETAASADAIAALIHGMQTATEVTVASISETRKLVDDGLHLGRDLETALGEILGSSEQAMNMSLEIKRSTDEVAQSIESVQKAIVELGEMSSQISYASKEEAQGIRSIVKSIEDIKNMTDDMVFATERQRQNSDEIDRSFEQVSHMSQKIFSALEERRLESLKVVEKLEGLKQASA
jgi:methyl-accepting chemotaxis protein